MWGLAGRTDLRATYLPSGGAASVPPEAVDGEAVLSCFVPLLFSIAFCAFCGCHVPSHRSPATTVSLMSGSIGSRIGHDNTILGLTLLLRPLDCNARGAVHAQPPPSASHGNPPLTRRG